MYEYIRGTLAEVAPAYAIIDCNGIGYYISISVNTYSQISTEKNVTLYIYSPIPFRRGIRYFLNVVGSTV